MPVLNSVNGVRVGGSLVKYVRAGGRVIWQARKIVGWSKIGSGYEIDAVSNSRNRLEFTNSQAVEGLQVLDQYDEVYVSLASSRDPFKVVSKEITSRRVRVFVDTRIKDQGFVSGEQVAFWAPKYG